MSHDSDSGDILIVEHTADWALRLRGRDLNELFTRAAEGMAYLLAGDISAIPLTETRELALEAYDAEELLVVWLGELAYCRGAARGGGGLRFGRPAAGMRPGSPAPH